MKTQIYENYSAFLNRENKKENGASKEFVIKNPDWELKNQTNESCWNCSDCSDCSGCSRCSDCSGCSRCSDCSGCSRCSDCSGCSGCSRCSRCSGCSDCSRCSDCFDCSGLVENAPKKIIIPIVENIHQKVLELVQKEGAFNMSGWCDKAENVCGMTYCRGGAAVLSAGDMGKKLVNQTSWEFAAMAIYSKSSSIKVSPVRFYEDNEKAMKDIIRCADEEKKLLTK